MAVRKQSFDPGLTQQFSGDLRRAINKDGTFNVHRRHAGLSNFNPYLFLVDTSWPKFLVVVTLGTFAANLLFAALYVAIGIENLIGAGPNTGLGSFASAFFFSVHTLTTVGYGSVYPKGGAANTVAAIEAMIGLMGFALATGLLFARFSRPSAKIIFSNNALIAPYQDVTSFQFRIANRRDNTLMEVQARVLLMTVDKTAEGLRREYADLPLERPNVLFFPLTWTVVHIIDENSPMFGKTAEDFARTEAEFLILIKGFDETFSQTVNARYSYRHDELTWNARFVPAFSVNPGGDLVLEIDRIHDRKVLSN